ncbi:MAG: hypothetical protein ACE5IQ_10985 [Candidatus Methylomirabilales bacterium]
MSIVNNNKKKKKGTGLNFLIDTICHWFFPERVRVLPGARAWSITFRTLHLAAFGVLLGGHAFSVDAEKLLSYLWLTILSGLGLIALEVYAEGLYWLFLGKGITVLAKLGILLAVPLFWEQRVALLVTVVVIASVGSHMPARFRHYSFLHGRVIGVGEPLRPPARVLQPEVRGVTTLEGADSRQR